MTPALRSSRSHTWFPHPRRATVNTRVSSASRDGRGTAAQDVQVGSAGPANRDSLWGSRLGGWRGPGSRQAAASLQVLPASTPHPRTSGPTCLPAPDCGGAAVATAPGALLPLVSAPREDTHVPPICRRPGQCVGAERRPGESEYYQSCCLSGKDKVNHLTSRCVCPTQLRLLCASLETRNTHNLDQGNNREKGFCVVAGAGLPGTRGESFVPVEGGGGRRLSRSHSHKTDVWPRRAQAVSGHVPLAELGSDGLRAG